MATTAQLMGVGVPGPQALLLGNSTPQATTQQLMNVGMPAALALALGDNFVSSPPTSAQLSGLGMPVTVATLISGSSGGGGSSPQPLTPNTAQITVGAPAGMVFYTPTNKTAGSTFTWAPNSSGDANKAVIGFGGTSLVIGSVAAGAGTIAGTITETLNGVSVQTPITITITALTTPVLLESFDSLTGFAVGGAGTAAVVTTSPTYRQQGTGAIQVTGNGTNGTINLTKTIGTYDPNTWGVLAYYTASQSSSTLSTIATVFKLTTGGTFSSQTLGASQISYGSAFRDESQWNAFAISEEPTIGATTPGTPASIDMRVYTQGNSPYRPLATIDGLMANAKGRPTVVWTFDDCHQEQRTIAYPYLAQYGIQGTVNIPINFVGGMSNGSTVQNPLYNLTLADIQFLDSQGWCIAQDMSVDDDYIGSPVGRLTTIAAVLGDYNANDAWLAANTSGRGRGILCYPNGAYDIGPVVSLVAALTTTSGSAAVVAGAAPTVPVTVGMVAFGPNIPVGTTVTAVADTTHFTLSANATASGALPCRFEDRSSPFQFPLLPTALATQQTGANAGVTPMKMGRTTRGYQQYSRFGFGANEALIHTGSGTSGKTLATMKAYVDQAVLRGTTACFYTHSITAAGGSINMSIADFQALADYIGAYKAAGALDTLTVDQWYARDIGGASALP